jgi:hypothetical protein
MVAMALSPAPHDGWSAAARREFDLLSLDRFSCEGMAATIGHLQRLSSHGVSFHSFTEEHLSTDNELVRNILLATLASLAKLEREKISQRTKVGLERARAMGTLLGWPKFSDGDRQKLRAALDTGSSWHAVSRATKIPYSTVKKHVRLMATSRGNRATPKLAMVNGWTPPPCRLGPLPFEKQACRRLPGLPPTLESPVFCGDPRPFC